MIIPAIEIDTDQTMSDCADFVKSKCGTDYGFIVLVLPFGLEPRVAHCISNYRREDMIAALRESLDVLEARLYISDVRSAD